MNEDEKKPEEEVKPVIQKEEELEVKAQPEKIEKKEPKINFGNIFLGIILIAIGITFLGNNMGWFEVNISIWQLWPLLIIYIGLSILSHRGWVAGIIVSVITLIVLAIVGSLILLNTISEDSKKVTHSEYISIDREADAESALINIETGAGKLIIDGGNENKLLTGNHKSNYTKLDKESKVHGDVQKVTLETNGNWQQFGGHINNLDLAINSFLPVELELDTGASNMDLDLSEVKAEKVYIDTGATRLDLIMGDMVRNSSVIIKAGASSIDITLPRAVGARVEIDAGVSSKNLKDFNKIDTNTYESDNYDTAENKVSFDFDVGLSSLDIDWE